jgi:3-methylfumaryl-CoA hydratase
LTFITVRHEISQRGLVALVEEQDIVYRPQARLVANASVDVAPDAITPDFGFGFIVDPIVLFRFSALTYNSHRIHYDRPYAELEGYPDLVIHGPLQVVLMGEALRRAGVSLLGRQFDFRLLAPAFGSQRLDVGASVTPEPGAVASAYVRSADGQLTAQSFVRDVAS